MNASGGCEAAVTARTRIGWMKWLDEISRIWRNITWEKVFAEVKGKDLSKLCEICATVLRRGVWWKRSCQF